MNAWLREHQKILRSEFAAALRKIKSGPAYNFILSDVLKDNVYEAWLPDGMSNLIEGYKEKLIFVGKVVDMGAIYIGPRTHSLQSILQKKNKSDCYVISVSEDAIRDTKFWEQNREVFMELLKGHYWGAPRKQNVVIIKDCSALKLNLEKVNITRYHDQKVETEDFADDVQPRSEKCVARCAKEKFIRPDPGQPLQRPLKRRIVKIACPAQCCESRHS